MKEKVHPQYNFAKVRCACGNTFETGSSMKHIEVEICGVCQGYLKTVDVAGLSPFPLLAVYDMETMDLDLAAMEHGYSRPPLRDFSRRR